jgi:tetratricopeptide (TPR) repeat protein/predicted Ser/Thr protein kinase
MVKPTPSLKVVSSAKPTPHRTPLTAGITPQKVRLLPGRIVPGTRYKIVRWLGEGGMGVVYEAKHEDIERRVALKVLRVDARQHPEMARLFREEARLASRIGSKYVAEVFDFGELPDGRLMFAMELVEGHNLADAVEEGPLPARRLIPILRQVCKGLHAAQEAGIIHRDIKPENILLTTRKGRSDAVKIVDFGISKVQVGDEANVFDGMGTPEFMAPERCAGMPCDARIDMYALACTAYDVIVGKPPFIGSAEEVLRAQLEEEPVPPRDAAPNADLPPALQNVLLRCLAKHKEDRYRDFQDLEAAICEAQVEAELETDWDHLQLPSVDPERIERLTRLMPSPEATLERARRKKWWLPVAAAVGLALAASLAVGLASGNEVGAEAAVVDQLKNEAREAAAQAYYLYPPAGQPDGMTAYRKILQLEALEEGAEELGDEWGKVLRTEFSDALVRLGDRYWDRAGGRGFATEFYVQALVFSEDEEARRRAGVLSGELTLLRDKAAAGQFSESEILAARPLVILADEDDDQVVERLAAMGPPEAVGYQARAIDSMLEAAGRPGDSGQTLARPEQLGLAASAGHAAGSPQVAAGQAPHDLPESGSTRPTEPVRTKRDPAAARELVKQARRNLRRGDSNGAEKLFYQALAYDNRNARALMGLSDIHFDRSSHQKAVRFGEKAVGAAPRNGDYRIRLGDAYFKLFRYKDAEKQYKAASRLGHRDARGRIDKLNKKLGR